MFKITKFVLDIDVAVEKCLSAMEEQEKEVNEKNEKIVKLWDLSSGWFHILYYRKFQVKEGLDQLVRVAKMKQKKK